jgi:hypothetical protein
MSSILMPKSYKKEISSLRLSGLFSRLRDFFFNIFLFSLEKGRSMNSLPAFLKNAEGEVKREAEILKKLRKSPYKSIVKSL